MLIKFIFFCLLTFSVTLNVLFYYENIRLNGEVQRQFFKRIQERFEQTEPKSQKIEKQYPIIV